MSTKPRDPGSLSRRRPVTPVESPSGPAHWLRQYWYVVAGIVLLLAVAAWVAYETTKPLPGRAQPDEGRGHVQDGTPLTYSNRPPSSGPHYGTPQPYGIYEEEVPPGRWIHDLEHGAIVLLYNCPGGAKGCPDVVDQIRQLWTQLPRSKYGTVKLVATPYAQMDHKIAIVAWNRVDEMDTFDRDRLIQFYTAFVDKGPEDVP